jgi:VanZ family protein
MANLSLICQVFELSRQLRVTSWQAGLVKMTIAQIKEL